jgi:hypothetical protein
MEADSADQLHPADLARCLQEAPCIDYPAEMCKKRNNVAVLADVLVVCTRREQHG